MGSWCQVYVYMNRVITCKILFLEWSYPPLEFSQHCMGDFVCYCTTLMASVCLPNPARVSQEKGFAIIVSLGTHGCGIHTQISPLAIRHQMSYLCNVWFCLVQFRYIHIIDISWNGSLGTLKCGYLPELWFRIPADDCSCEYRPAVHLTFDL